MNSGTKTSSRLAITVTTVLSALIVLIDTTVANVALPDMMGALGANANQITWVLTSFTMAQAIFIPLTGYFTEQIGERKLMIISIAGFVVSSALCGQATALGEMILFRIAQGLFGASVIPLAQSIMVQIYPESERGKAMAIYSIGVLVGPILGPVVGGIITEHLSWRWVFYINLPIGCLCLVLILRNIHICNRGTVSIDWLIAISMAVGVGLLQMVLSLGDQENWFRSDLILGATAVCVLSLGYFIANSIITRSFTAPVWMLKNRNLGISCLMLGCFGMCTFGILQMQPMMLQKLLNYPAETSGFVMAPRGLASATVLIFMARFVDKIDTRLLIFVGLLLNLFGVGLMTRYTLDIDLFWVILPTVIQGAGQGLVFSSIAKIAFSYLPPAWVTHGSSLLNLCRSVGLSVGVAVVNTFYAQVDQKEWHSLGGALTPDNPVLQQYARSMEASLTAPSFLEHIAQLVEQQASMLGFLHVFALMACCYIFLILLLALLRSPQK